MSINWNRMLLGQIEFYWEFHLRPRLEGLTDEEYFWEPMPGSWSVRRGPDGAFVIDSAQPDPEPSPVTTIAWRMVHIGGFCLGNRANAFFHDGGAGDEVTMFDDRFVPVPLPGTAQDAIAYVERAYTAWHDGVAGLDEQGLLRPLGPRGAGFADEPMVGLVLHLSRELMHHGGEICLLRDLYRAGFGQPAASRVAAGTG